jgi:hypothetical protein
MPRLKWFLFFLLSLTISGLTRSADSDSNQFQQFLLKASQISSLTSPDSIPQCLGNLSD